MDITQRLLRLSWVNLLHRIECGCDFQNPDKLTQEDMATVLTGQQLQVITMRYGLKDGMPNTLDVVGRQIGVTRERIRQIEAKAIRILKAEKERKENGGNSND